MAKINSFAMPLNPKMQNAAMILVYSTLCLAILLGDCFLCRREKIQRIIYCHFPALLSIKYIS